MLGVYAVLDVSGTAVQNSREMLTLEGNSLMLLVRHSVLNIGYTRHIRVSADNCNSTEVSKVVQVCFKSGRCILRLLVWCVGLSQLNAVCALHRMRRHNGDVQERIP